MKAWELLNDISGNTVLVSPRFKDPQVYAEELMALAGARRMSHDTRSSSGSIASRLNKFWSSKRGKD